MKTIDSATQNTSQNRFEILQDDLLSVADYELSAGVLTITHVVVAPQLRGQGVASLLASAIVQHARACNLKIRPQCPFMAAYLDRHPENADLRV